MNRPVSSLSSPVSRSVSRSVSPRVSARYSRVSKRAFAITLITCAWWSPATFAGEGGAPTSGEAGGGGAAGGAGSALEYIVGCISDTDCGAHQLCTGTADDPGACVAVADATTDPDIPSDTPEDAAPEDEAPQCAVASPGAPRSGRSTSPVRSATSFLGSALLLFLARRRRSAGATPTTAPAR